MRGVGGPCTLAPVAYTITQVDGVGAGGADQALDGAWIDAEIVISLPDGGVGATYLHEVLDTTPDLTVTLATATSRACSFTPDAVGSARIRSTMRTALGVPAVYTRIVRVTQDAAGADANSGVCPIAFNESPSEANYGSNTRGYVERLNRNEAALVAAGGGGAGVEAPTASTTVKRTSGGVVRAAGMSLENGSGNCSITASTDGETLNALDLTASAHSMKSSAAGTNRIKITPAADGSAALIESLSSADASNPCTVAAAATKILGTSQRCANASDAYGRTYTPGAAATIVYDAAITSLSDTMAQVASGAGAARYMEPSLGAAGSANGKLHLGLRNGNTVLGGGVFIGLGTPASSVSDPLKVGTGTPGSLTPIVAISQYAASSVKFDSAGLTQAFAAANIRFDATAWLSFITGSGSFAAFQIPSGDMYLEAGTVHRYAAGQSYKREVIGSATTTSATTTTVGSFTTASNVGYRVRVVATAYNGTDSQIATYVREAAFRNVAGTLTQVGATGTIGTDFEDAAQTGMDLTIDASGTAIRARVVSDSTDTVKWRTVIEIWETIA